MMMIKLPAVLSPPPQRGVGLIFFEYVVLATPSGRPSWRRCRGSPTSPPAWKHAATSPGSAAQAPGRPAGVTPTGAGYTKVVGAAAGYRQAFRDYLIDTLTPGRTAQARRHR